MDESHRLSRAVEIGRMLIKYRNAGIFSTIELDNPLLRDVHLSNDTPEGKPEEFVRDLEALRQRLAKSLSPANLASEIIEVQELLRDSPRRISQLLNTLAENKFRVHVAGLEESRLIESMQKIANRISAGVITAAMILGATLMMRVPTATMIFGYPALALILFLLAAGLGSTLVLQVLLTDRKAKPPEQRGPT